MSAPAQAASPQALAEALRAGLGSADPTEARRALAAYQAQREALLAQLPPDGNTSALTPEQQAALEQLQALDATVREAAAQFALQEAAATDPRIAALLACMRGEGADPPRVVRNRARILARHHIRESMLAELALRSREGPVDLASYDEPIGRYYRELERSGNSANAAIMVELTRIQQAGVQGRISGAQEALADLRGEGGAALPRRHREGRIAQLEQRVTQAQSEHAALANVRGAIPSSARRRADRYPQQLLGEAERLRQRAERAEERGDTQAAERLRARAQQTGERAERVARRRVEHLDQARETAQANGRERYAARLAHRQARTQVTLAQTLRAGAAAEVQHLDPAARERAAGEERFEATPPPEMPPRLNEAVETLTRAREIDPTVAEEPSYQRTLGQVHDSRTTVRRAQVAAHGRPDIAYAGLGNVPASGPEVGPGGEARAPAGPQPPEATEALGQSLEALGQEQLEAERAYGRQARIYEERAGVPEGASPERIAQAMAALPHNERRDYQSAVGNHRRVHTDRVALSDARIRAADDLGRTMTGIQAAQRRLAGQQQRVERAQENVNRWSRMDLREASAQWRRMQEQLPPPGQRSEAEQRLAEALEQGSPGEARRAQVSMALAELREAREAREATLRQLGYAETPGTVGRRRGQRTPGTGAWTLPTP